MDLFLFARQRATGGGDPFLVWEFGGESNWDKVSAPGQIGKRVAEGFLQRPIPERWARLTNNVMHWGYGIAWGAAYGAVAASLPRRPRLFGGLFGSSVWASSYVSMPLAGLYQPIWEYRFSELAPDLAAHLVYGTTTARVFGLVSGDRPRA